MTMIPFTAYPSDIDDGGTSWNVQSTQSPTRLQNTINDRPNISILRQSPDLLGSSHALLCSPPRISKQEFIERWLQAHSIHASNDISASQSTSSSSSSVIPNSPQLKRLLRSPLKDCNQLKRFKKHDTTVQTLELTFGSIESKENHIDTVSNNINNDADHISEASSSNCTSRSKLDVCRSAIFGVPKRNVQAVTIQPAQSQLNRAIFDGSQSPRITDIESASSNNCESPKKLEIISVASSTPSKVGFQICESESSDEDHDDRTGLQVVTVEDDSSSDRTASDIIEDADRNIPEEMNTTLVEGVIDDSFDDADRTFICQDGPMVRQLSNEIVEVLSQHISSVTGSADDDNPGCPPPPLKYIAPPIRPVAAPAYFAPKRRKRKRKPGSVTARLIKLVAVKRSDVRVWRHYLSKQVPETSRKEYFSIRISRTICIGGRHCFVGLVASDSYNLLEKFRTGDNNFSTPDEIVGMAVTAMTDSQLIGPKEMEQLDFVRIYPPWQLLDADKFIFKATYFTVHRNENPCDITEAMFEENQTEVLQEFNCPCLNAKRIVDACPVKYSEQKPTAISCILKPPRQRRSDSQIFVKED